VYDQKHIYPLHRAAAGADVRVLFIYEALPAWISGMARMMDCLDMPHSVFVGGYPFTHMGVH
jgi:hypothetical protein